MRKTPLAYITVAVSPDGGDTHHEAAFFLNDAGSLREVHPEYDSAGEPYFPWEDAEPAEGDERDLDAVRDVLNRLQEYTGVRS